VRFERQPANPAILGVEGFTSVEDQEAFDRIEKQLKRRFEIGTFVSEAIILDEFERQNYDAGMVKKVIEYCIHRGESKLKS